MLFLWQFCTASAFIWYGKSVLMPWIVVAGIFGLAFAAADQLQDKLDRPVSASWQRQQLANVLDRLAASQQLTIWLDRRVDPQRSVDAQFHQDTLRNVFDRLTEDNSLGWSHLGEIIYLGPRESARELATLGELARQAIGRLSAKNRKRWLTPTEASWPRLAEPRKILSDWLVASEIPLKNADALPHDLWMAKQLPPVSLIDRVILLLVGFDATCKLSNDGCQIVPIDRPVQMTHRYLFSPQLEQTLAELEHEPEIKIVRSGRSVTLAARWEDHLRLRSTINGTTAPQRRTPSPRPQSARQVFSLRLENQPVGKVLDQIAGQLKLRVTWDPTLVRQTPDVRESLVSCEVSHVDAQTLLAEVLKPTGLGFELRGDELRIVRGK